jgi:hypothetical protein
MRRVDRNSDFITGLDVPPEAEASDDPGARYVRPFYLEVMRDNSLLIVMSP